MKRPARHTLRTATVAVCTALAIGCLSAGELAFAGEEPVEEKFTWSMELDCTGCHTRNADSFVPASETGEAEETGTSPSIEDVEAKAADSAEEAPAHDLASEEEAAPETVVPLASKHANLKTLCTVCHDDEDGLTKAHKRVKVTSVKKSERLKRTDVANAACLTCHDEQGIAEATADSLVLTDENGTVVNPHALMPSESHDNVTCASCHKVHGDQPLEQSANQACLNCHHQNVYECYTCHK